MSALLLIDWLLNIVDKSEQSHNQHNRMTTNIKTLRIVSWNIWFDKYRMKTRMHHIMNIMNDYKADIFCFQEVTQESFQLLTNHEYIKDCYISSTIMNDAYQNVIFSKYPILNRDVLKYKFSNMLRKLVTIDVKINNELFKICTTHLESLEPNRPQRISQLKQSVNYIMNSNQDNKPKHFIYCGDFNECGTKNADVLPFPDKQFKDCWIEYYNEQNNTGWTMPQIENYAAWRPDRIYFAFNYDYKQHSYKEYMLNDGYEQELKQDNNMPLLSLDECSLTDNKQDVIECVDDIKDIQMDKSNGVWKLDNVYRIGMDDIPLSEDELFIGIKSNILTPSDHYGVLAQF
eukprot:310251_1